MLKTEKFKPTKKIKEDEITAAVTGVPLWVKIILYVITTGLAISTLIPLLLTVSISLMDADALATHGYTLFPKEISFEAYKYILNNGAKIWRSYGVTIFVTISGTILGLAMMTLYAYAISRKYFPWRNTFTFFIFFTMLFNGGTVPSYIVITQILHLQDKIGVLILCGCLSTMYILIMRTYMQTSIPDAVVESAKIDGAGEFLCYYKIVLPMAVPTIATIALFLAIAYWNAWYPGFLYILQNEDIVPIQLLLKRIENQVQFLNSNASSLSYAESEKLRQALPSDAVKMCLVVMIALPILIAYPFFQRFFIRGITIGAVKG